MGVRMEPPHGFESLITLSPGEIGHGEVQAIRRYALSETDITALQQEGAQYYHRYLSLFQLRDFRKCHS